MQTETLNSQTHSGTVLSGASGVVIVADDLTGACDSGVAFVATGCPVRVMLDTPPVTANITCHPEIGEGVVSYTTESRNLPETQAGERVAEVMAILASTQPNAIVFKKVDSAARGNFGAETIAAIEASGTVLALVAPAFPQAERTVHSGILSVRDLSGQDSRISLRDQFSSLDSTCIGILHTCSEAEVQLGIRRAIANGIRILLCDTDTQEDLERLAAAGSQLPQSPLWVGSAGLAQALAGTLPISISEKTLRHERRQGRTLLFVGSTHPVTRLQLARLEEQTPESEHAVVPVDCMPASEAEIRGSFTAEPTAALILTGGDTAAFVLKALDASSILLAGELAPGIPWGFVEGGVADGCMVVTKSGGFGDRDALKHAVEFCARRSQ